MCFFRKRRERKALEAKETVLVQETVVPKDEMEVKPKPKVVTSSKKTVDKASKYHVSQNKDEKAEHYKEWRIRKEGSTKTIKYFSTQKEAIDFANKLAEEAGSSVVIHKLDGSIRKQDYEKKA